MAARNSPIIPVVSIAAGLVRIPTTRNSPAEISIQGRVIATTLLHSAGIII